MWVHNCINANSNSCARHEVGSVVHSELSDDQVNKQDHLCYFIIRNTWIVVFLCEIVSKHIKLLFNLLLLHKEPMIPILLLMQFVSFLLVNPVSNILNCLLQEAKRSRKLLDIHLNLLFKLHLGLNFIFL